MLSSLSLLCTRLNRKLGLSQRPSTIHTEYNKKDDIITIHLTQETIQNLTRPELFVEQFMLKQFLSPTVKSETQKFLLEDIGNVIKNKTHYALDFNFSLYWDLSGDREHHTQTMINTFISLQIFRTPIRLRMKILCNNPLLTNRLIATLPPVKELILEGYNDDNTIYAIANAACATVETLIIHNIAHMDRNILTRQFLKLTSLTLRAPGPGYLPTGGGFVPLQFSFIPLFSKTPNLKTLKISSMHFFEPVGKRAQKNQISVLDQSLRTLPHLEELEISGTILQNLQGLSLIPVFLTLKTACVELDYWKKPNWIIYFFQSLNNFNDFEQKSIQPEVPKLETFAFNGAIKPETCEMLNKYLEKNLDGEISFIWNRQISPHKDAELSYTEIELQNTIYKRNKHIVKKWEISGRLVEERLPAVLANIVGEYLTGRANLLHHFKNGVQPPKQIETTPDINTDVKIRIHPGRSM